MVLSPAVKKLLSGNPTSRCFRPVWSDTSPSSTRCPNTYSALHQYPDEDQSVVRRSGRLLYNSRDFSTIPDRAEVVQYHKPYLVSPLLQSSLSIGTGFRLIPQSHVPFQSVFRPSLELAARKSCRLLRNFSHGSVTLVISPEGHPKFETHETEPPKKEKWKTKKRLKLQRKREKEKRKAANKRDPRRLGIKGKKKKQKFANAEERIKDKLEKAKVKEALLIERLKRYEVAKVQGPVVKPHELTGEERFYLKKMAQKRSNYVPIGRRGVFGGVILNMHMHWKKHETVKVISNSSKPGQIEEFAQEIARLSGGFPVQIIGDDTVVFYRGKNYVQPEVMSPIDTLSKKRALEKSKYEQSLESVRRFIAIAEKELELYYRHVALYGDPNDRNPHSMLDKFKRARRVGQQTKLEVTEEENGSSIDNNYEGPSESEELQTTDQEISGSEELSEFDDNFKDDDELGSGESTEESCELGDMFKDDEESVKKTRRDSRRQFRETNML